VENKVFEAEVEDETYLFEVASSSWIMSNSHVGSFSRMTLTFCGI
jgi:hypothetical protein